MGLPRLAIIGRPNVGKSSLFNRLAGQRISIVDPTPGVTRDRITTVVELRPPPGTQGEPRFAEIMDTGGYGVYVAEGGQIDDAGKDLTALTPDIEAQIRAAAGEAQLILFVIDAQDGIVPLDEAVARLLRSAGLSGKVMVVANKVDDPSWDADGIEAAALGFGEPFFSAAQLELDQRARLSFTSGFRVVPAGLGQLAPLVGAAALARRAAPR